MTADKQIIWQGPGWRLQEETAVLPDGREMAISAIRHPGAVVLVPIRRQNSGWQVLVLQQYRPVIAQTILELPAGTLEWGEAYLPAAQRELREETGLRAETFTPLGEFWPVPGSSDEKMALYLAQNLSPAPLPQDEDEIIETEWRPLAELIEMAYDGRILDGKTVVALLRAERFLNDSAS